MAAPVTVLKFGSSVLSDRGRLPSVVHHIYRAVRRGRHVVAVVSAIGRHTDVLLDEAHHIAEPAICDRALATLLGTGELQSAALLCMAVKRAGIPCTLLDPESLHLTLKGERLDGDPYALNRRAFDTAFRQGPVAIVPGFVGQYEHGGPGLMGRGGSDLTAVFIAEQLNADTCYLVKDVDGIYEHDPADVTLERAPRRFADVTYEDALRVADVLIQPKAVEYLQVTRRRAEVVSLLHDRGTVVGATRSQLAPRASDEPLGVAMIGLGALGESVYRHLKALPMHFEFVGIGVRDVECPRGVPSVPRYADVDELLEQPFDVLVDVSGDTDRAYGWIEQCLQRGLAVVTADKRLVARYGAFIADTATRQAATFRYSAAVGGAVPMLELIERLRAQGPIDRLRGVLDGAGNDVLQRLVEGATLEEAVAAVATAEDAAAESCRDRLGEDSVDQLRILARSAWGAEIGGAPIVCEGIDSITPEQLMHARKKHRNVRLVASMDVHGRGVVQPEWLLPDDPLAHVTGSVLEVRSRDATYVVSGLRSGRWPAAEAVVADLVDVYQQRAACTDEFSAVSQRAELRATHETG